MKHLTQNLSKRLKFYLKILFIIIAFILFGTRVYSQDICC
jgi:hypothetical protein